MGLESYSKSLNCRKRFNLHVWLIGRFMLKYVSKVPFHPIRVGLYIVVRLELRGYWLGLITRVDEPVSIHLNLSGTA